jgi:hypothetical protein
MGGILQVDTIQNNNATTLITQTNTTTLTFGVSGQNIVIPSGVTFNASSASVNLPAINLTTGVTGTLPVANGGTNLSSGFANGITEADQFRLTANLTGTNGVISANLERIDTAGQGTLGTGMTQSSGIFTFPSTGIWLVMFSGSSSNDTAADNMTIALEVTTNNSTYTTIALTSDSSGGIAQDQLGSLICSSLIDVTSTANVKVRFQTSSFAAGSTLNGDTTLNWATFTFIRLGDT